MPRTPADAAAWFRAGVARTINKGDWEGGCVAAVYTAGTYGHSYDYAVAAAVAAGATYAGGHALPATGKLNANPNAAGDGSIHYWGGIWNSALNRWDGHIGLQYGGLIYMASVYARRQYGRHHLGASTWAEYSADRGLPYLGHSPYFGNQLLAGVNPAALNSRPLDGGTATQTLREVTVIGYNYNVQGASLGAKVLADPVSMTYRYPTADERSAFEQSGGLWVNLSDAMWNEILGQFLEIKKPPQVSAAQAVDYKQLAAALAPLLKFPTKGTVELS
jgi:hypothetical protein